MAMPPDRRLDAPARCSARLPGCRASGLGWSGAAVPSSAEIRWQHGCSSSHPAQEATPRQAKPSPQNPQGNPQCPRIHPIPTPPAMKPLWSCHESASVTNRGWEDDSRAWTATDAICWTPYSRRPQGRGGVAESSPAPNSPRGAMPPVRKATCWQDEQRCFMDE